MVSRLGGIGPGLLAPGLLGSVLLGLVPGTGGALAQANLDAGKSPAQIFSDTCNACHRSPRELKPTSPAFLREHYTTGAREAAAMAAYVASVGSDPRAVQQRRPPTMGAGREPAPQAAGPSDQGRPADAQAALSGAPTRRANDQARSSNGQAGAEAFRPRRPSDSLEAVKPLAVLENGAIAAPEETPSPRPAPPEPFEE